MESLIVVSERETAQPDGTRWTDRMGMLASIGCAIHCAAMPLVIVYLPSLGLSWMSGEGFHRWMALICAAIAISAFVPGWRRHRKLAPAILGLVGIGMLSSAAFVLEPCCAACESNESTTTAQASTGTPACEECDACGTCESSTIATSTIAASAPGLSLSLWGYNLTPFVTPFGGLVLVIAHLLNHRFGCACCSGEQACATFVEGGAHV